MPINLDTHDETGRDLVDHRLTRTDQSFDTTIQLTTTDVLTQAIIEDRLSRFIHNLGDGVTVEVDVHSAIHHHLDNFDF